MQHTSDWTIPAPSSSSSFPIISPNTHKAGRRVLTDLPSYQWDHTKSYWLESRHSREWRNRQFLPYEILGTRLPVRALAIKTAMILHDSKDKENDVLTTLRKAKLTAKDGDDTPWWEFSITSFNGSVWSEHCRGPVRARVSQSPTDKNDDEERFVRKVSANRWYKTLQKIGFSYGPTFRGLSEIAVDPITRESVVFVENVSHRQREELHPCEMDKMLQLMTVTQHAGDPTSFKQLAMPTYFEEIAVGAGFSGREKFKVSASSQFDHIGTWSGNLSATLDDAGEKLNRKTVFHIKGLSVSAMGSSAAEARESKPKNSVELVWQPDIPFLSSEEIAPLIRTPLDLREQQLALEKYFVLLALETVPLVLDIETGEPHLDIFRSWLKRFVATARDGKHPLLGAAGAELCALEQTKRTVLLAEMKTSLEASPLSSLATCLSRVAETAVQRFRGEVDSISVLMEGGALTEFYAFVDRSWDYAPLLRSIGHNKPTLRVLEIGAGTGGTTSNMLRGLRCEEFDERLYLKYCYTDISAGFFVAAKERFKDHPGMEYRVLDITQDPVEQGFEEGGYDLILAANVLHATPCLQETLKNVRKLLDTKGRLLLQEIHTQFSWPGFVMGGLSGWWLGQDDGRTDGPAASPERWEDELQGAGFAGIKAMAGYTQKKETRPCSTPRQDGTPCNSTNFEWVTEDITDEKYKDICYDCTNDPRPPPREPTGPAGPRPPNHPTRPSIVPSVSVTYETEEPISVLDEIENFYPADSPSPDREGGGWSRDRERPAYVGMTQEELDDLGFVPPTRRRRP
ncbi:hypothetical protein V8F06_013235 [Rhypophila decipiens]